MDNFTFQFQMPISEYRKFSIREYYRKPATMIATLIGVGFIAYSIFGRSGKSVDIVQLGIGFAWLAAPVISTMMFVSRVSASPYFKEVLTYEVSEPGVNIRGLTFKGEYTWRNFVKRRESGDFLILLQSKREAVFFSKRLLTESQLQFIRSKVPA